MLALLPHPVVVPIHSFLNSKLFCLEDVFNRNVDQYWNYVVSNFEYHPGGRGAHDLRMNGGLPPSFQKATLFLLLTVAVIPIFMINFGGN